MKKIYVIAASVMLLTSCSPNTDKATWNGELLLGYQIGLFQESDQIATETIRERLVIKSGSGTLDNGKYLVSISGLKKDADGWSFASLSVTPHDPVEFKTGKVTIRYTGEKLSRGDGEGRRVDMGKWVTIGELAEESKEYSASLKRNITQFEEAGNIMQRDGQMIGIFTHKNNVYEVLKQLDGTGASSHHVFDDLFEFFREHELNVKYVTATSRNNSHAFNAKTEQPEPCLCLYVPDSTSFQSMGVNEADSNWDFSYPGTKMIVDKWTSLCQVHGVSHEYYSDTMFVFIYNLRKYQLNNHVRSCKPLVEIYFKEYAEKEPERPKPKWVFVSSEPAIRVFYETPAQLAEETESGNTENHRKAIEQILASDDGCGCYEADSVLVEFLDCQTQSKNMYGFSRED